MTAKSHPIIYARYKDLVFFNRGDPLTFSPWVRETVGWLVYECDDYVTISWDRDAGPPTLKNGDPQASGLVILRSGILELKRLNQLDRCRRIEGEKNGKSDSKRRETSLKL